MDSNNTNSFIVFLLIIIATVLLANYLSDVSIGSTISKSNFFAGILNSSSGILLGKGPYCVNPVIPHVSSVEPQKVGIDPSETAEVKGGNFSVGSKVFVGLECEHPIQSSEIITEPYCNPVSYPQLMVEETEYISPNVLRFDSSDLNSLERGLEYRVWVVNFNWQCQPTISNADRTLFLRAR